MNILQNLFQHSKALLHLANLPVMEQKKILAFFKRRNDGFNQTPLFEAFMSEDTY